MTNTMNTPPCIYRSGCQRRDCVDQCLGLHSNREKQATQAPSKELLVFKATPKHYPDSPCHFGDYTTARAWAGDGGTIETVTLRPQPKLVQSDHEPLSGEALLKNLEGQCQALWRTNFTLVCTLPRGHDGDHRADCGYTFNGEVDVRPSPPPLGDASPALDYADAIAQRRAAQPPCPAPADTLTELADWLTAHSHTQWATQFGHGPHMRKWAAFLREIKR